MGMTIEEKIEWTENKITNHINVAIDSRNKYLLSKD